MIKFLNLRPEVFAVDINDFSVKIVKLKKRRGSFCLASFGEAEIGQGIVKEGVIQDEDGLAKIIRSVCLKVKGERLGTKYVIASLPEEKSFLQIIQLPKMEREELKSAVFFEAENYIPLSMDKIYLDFDVINYHSGEDGQNHLDALINAMPKYVVNSYVSCLKKAGLSPVALEPESQAIIRALAGTEKNDAPVIFVDFSQTKTNFIIYSKNSIRFTSSIAISSHQITKSISDGLGISFSDAEKIKMENGVVDAQGKENEAARFINPILLELAKFIKKYADFYHERSAREHFLPDGKINKIILCGGGAKLKGLADFLSKELNIGVELGHPFKTVIVKKKKSFQSIFTEKELSFATAVGLALRGIGADKLTTI